MHMLTAHPFTVCSMLQLEMTGKTSTQLNLSDSSVVVGGVAGPGFTLSVFEHFLQRCTTTRNADRRLKVVVATRESDIRVWYLEALRDISHRSPRFNEAVAGISIDFHETDQSGPEEKTASNNSDVEKALDSATVQLNNEDSQSDSQNPSVAEVLNVSFHKGRPNLPITIQAFVAGQEDVMIGLLACGPINHVS